MERNEFDMEFSPEDEVDDGEFNDSIVSNLK